MTLDAAGKHAVVKFALTDQDGAPLKGLQSGQPEFAIAQLIDGAQAKTGYTSAGGKQWVNFVISQATPPSPCPVTGACTAGTTTLGTTEAGDQGNYGTLADNGDGTYSYTFFTDVTSVVTGAIDSSGKPIAWDPKRTTRVGFHVGGVAPANNAIYDFVPAGGNVTDTRDIIDTATCNNCHQQLSAHGGDRKDLRYCVMCHNPQSVDPVSGNSIDMKVMVHKIHTGLNLPSAQPVANPAVPVAGKGYWLNGHGGVVDFQTVRYPQDTRYCETCHVQGTVSTPTADLADSYKLFPSIEACGACHDKVDFATGGSAAAGTLHAGGVADNSLCTTCHGATAQINSGKWQVKAAHVPEGDTAAATFQYLVNSVTFSAQGGSTYPVVNFAIVDPTNANKPWNILADAPFVGVDPGSGKAACTGAARLAIDLAWDTSDYTNWKSPVPAPTPSTWGQPVSLNPLIPGAGGVPAGCTASTLAYGGAAVPATPAPSTMYGPDANGTFTVVGPALPATPAGNCADGNPCAPIQNVGVVMEGHPAVVLNNYASPPVPVTLAGAPITAGAQQQRIPVTSTVAYGNTANAFGAAPTVTPVARRQIVDPAKCNVCHNALSLHGGNRNGNTQICVACHNPASTDVSQRQALTAPGIDGLWERPIDFKQMIHGVHSANESLNYFGVLYTVYGFGGGPTDFTSIVMPAGANVGNCSICHVNKSGGFFTSPWVNQTFYPGDPLMQPTTTQTGLSKDPSIALLAPGAPGTPGNPIARTATAAACTGCHKTSLALSHMEQNGASDNVTTKDAEGRWMGSGAAVETCLICHGPGGAADIANVHSVSPPSP